jgi:uncharacterized protein YecE (DUF72 family)
MIKIGCCGFPKAKSVYFKNFKLVELQNTFYRIVDIKTIEKWRKEAPDDFEFSIKASQFITHSPSSPTYRKANIKIRKEDKEKYGFFRPTDEVFYSWDRTKEAAKVLRAKLILFQCPPSLTPSEDNIKNIRNFFKSIEREDFIFVWEPRGNWNMNEIENICKELDLVLCTDPLIRKPMEGKLQYFRLHGIRGYKYKYTEEDLLNIRSNLNKEIISYILFNNVYMFEDALRFKDMID